MNDQQTIGRHTGLKWIEEVAYCNWIVKRQSKSNICKTRTYTNMGKMVSVCDLFCQAYHNIKPQQTNKY